MSSEQTYTIPLKFRKMENLHIVFWLFKDISWCMIWRPLGIAMIFPTLIIAIVIAWRTREYMSELCHNLAIVFWISANRFLNSSTMASELAPCGFRIPLGSKACLTARIRSSSTGEA